MSQSPVDHTNRPGTVPAAAAPLTVRTSPTLELPAAAGAGGGSSSSSSILSSFPSSPSSTSQLTNLVEAIGQLYTSNLSLPLRTVQLRRLMREQFLDSLHHPAGGQTRDEAEIARWIASTALSQLEIDDDMTNEGDAAADEEGARSPEEEKTTGVLSPMSPPGPSASPVDLSVRTPYPAALPASIQVPNTPQQQMQVQVQPPQSVLSPIPSPGPNATTSDESGKSSSGEAPPATGAPTEEFALPAAPAMDGVRSPFSGGSHLSPSPPPVSGSTPRLESAQTPLLGPLTPSAPLAGGNAGSDGSMHAARCATPIITADDLNISQLIGSGYNTKRSSLPTPIRRSSTSAAISSTSLAAAAASVAAATSTAASPQLLNRTSTSPPSASSSRPQSGRSSPAPLDSSSSISSSTTTTTTSHSFTTAPPSHLPSLHPPINPCPIPLTAFALVTEAPTGSSRSVSHPPTPACPTAGSMTMPGAVPSIARSISDNRPSRSRADSTGSGGGGSRSGAPSRRESRRHSRIYFTLSPPVTEAMHKLYLWDFDLFEFLALVPDTPLTTMTCYLLERWGLFQTFNIDRATFHRFISLIESGYRKENAYHNAAHAADVVQNMHVLLLGFEQHPSKDTQAGALCTALTPLDVLAAIIAAAIHDYKHDGRTNLFHINTASDLAVRYNDVSVLECLEEGTIVLTSDPARPSLRVDDLTERDASAGLHLQGQAGPVPLVSVRHSVISHSKFVLTDEDGRTYEVTPNHRVTLVWRRQPTVVHAEADRLSACPRWQLELFVKTPTPHHAVGERVLISLRYWPVDVPLPTEEHDETTQAASRRRTPIAKAEIEEPLDLLAATRAVHRGTAQSAREELEALVDSLSLRCGDVIDLTAEELWARMETEFRSSTPKVADCVYAAISTEASSLPAGEADVFLSNEAGVRSVRIRSVVKHVRGDEPVAWEAKEMELPDLVAARQAEWRKAHPLRPEVREAGEKPYRFVSIEVGGNHRFVLGDGTLTHNSMHLSEAFSLILRHSECDIFASLSRDQRREIRETIIQMVLATDLKSHVANLTELQATIEQKKATGVWFDVGSRTDRLLLLKNCLHISDVSNPTKPTATCVRWADAIVAEWFIQGDMERQLGLEISPMMDRNNANVPKSQIGFMSFFIKPLFTTWAKVTSKTSIALDYLELNFQFWKAAEAKAAAQTAAAAAANAQEDAQTDHAHTQTGTSASQETGSTTGTASAPATNQPA